MDPANLWAACDIGWDGTFRNNDVLHCKLYRHAWGVMPGGTFYRESFHRLKLIATRTFYHVYILYWDIL